MLDFIKKLDTLGYKRYLIDTGPGYFYSSINSLVASDIVSVVLTLDEYDLEGAKTMISELYRPLGRKVAVLVNKVMKLAGEREEVMKKVGESLSIEAVGTLLCSRSVGMFPRNLIYVLERPEDPFTKSLETILERLEKL